MIQVYITNAYRAYRIADHYRARGVFVALGGLHVTSLPDEAARARRRDLPRPRRADVSTVSRGLPRRTPQPRVPVDRGTHARTRAADSPRSDRPPQLPRAQLHRGDARVSAALRLLLQGRVLLRRPHRSTRSASTMRWPRSRGCPGATSTSSTITCSATRASPRDLFERDEGHEPALPGRGDGGLDSARRSDRARRRGRAAQPVRRLRDADAGQPAAQRQAAESRPRLFGGRPRACTASAS